MRKILGILAAAGMVTFGAATASAQDVSVRFGIGDHAPRHHVVREVYGRPAYRDRVVERRIVRRAPVRTVCRTVIRERVRPSGVVVRRPVEECRRVYAGGRRVYVD